MKNWLEHMLDLEMPDWEVDESGLWTLEEVVEEVVDEAWSLVNRIPKVFTDAIPEDTESDKFEEFESTIVMLPSNVKGELRYGFNFMYESLDRPLQYSQVVPDMSPFGGRRISVDFIQKNLERGTVKVCHNWDEYLFAYTLTETEMQNIHYKLFDYVDDIVKFRIECNEEHRHEWCYVNDGKDPNQNPILEIYSGKLEELTEESEEPSEESKEFTKEPEESSEKSEVQSEELENPEKHAEEVEERGIVLAKLKVLYKEERLIARLSYLCQFLCCASYYWKLDLLYLTKIYALEIKGNYKNDSFKKELNKFLSLIDSDGIALEGGGFDEEICFNTWYKTLADIPTIDKEMDDAGMSYEPCWKMKLCLALFQDARRIFLNLKKKRADGYQYKDIQSLWENILRLCGQEDRDLEQYYFEALTGKELCRIESIYSTRIFTASKNQLEVKNLLNEVFCQFHEFPNICSRTVFVREIMEVFCVYLDDVEMIKIGLQYLQEILPQLIEDMTKNMEGTLSEILAYYKNDSDRLFKQANQLNLYDIWKKQLNYLRYDEDVEFNNGLRDKNLRENYRDFSKIYIRNLKK